MTTNEIPRLSPSIAKLLLEKSPKHAWDAHRLLGGHGRKASASQDKGKIIDSLVFGSELDKQPTDAMLAKCEPVAAAVKDSLQSRGIVGHPQFRVEWTLEGVDCSGVVDLLSLDTWTFYELKTISDCSDANIVKQIELYGYDLQMAAYAEGLACKGTGFAPPLGQLIFAEVDSPYDVRFVTLTAAMQRNGQDRWENAKRLWAKCLRDNNWPGRGDMVADVSPYRAKQAAEDFLNSE